MSFESDSERILDLLYEAPGDIAAWSRFLQEFSRFLNVDLATYVHFDDKNNAYPVTCASGCPPDFMEKYQGHYAAIDEWYLRARSRVSAAYVDDGQALCSVDELRQTEFYNDFLKPYGWLHECAAVLELNHSAITALTLVRKAHQGEFSQKEIEILRAFAPHLKRVVQLHHRFVDLQARSGAQRWALEQVPFGVILMRRDGSVILANSLAERICNGDGLSLSNRGFSATGLQDRTVQDLFRGMKRPILWPPPRATAFIRRRNGDFFTVAIGPVPSALSGSIEPVVAVFIHDQKAKTESPGKLLCKLYKLTPAESRLALLIAEGLGVREAANRLGVASSTARTQLKAIFQKTATSRQSALARLVAMISPPFQIL